MKRIVFFITLMMLFSFTASAQEYVKNWEKQAKAGNIKAQLQLGDTFFRVGELWKSNDKDKKSLKWFRKAADLGNVDACYEVAMLCLKGVSKDNPSVWLLKAAENGDDDMKMKVVDKLLSFNNQKDKAYDLLMSMAEKGDNSIKIKVVDKLSSFNQKDKASEILLSMAEKGDNDIKMQVADTLLSIGEKSKAIMLLKSWAEQSTSFDWTKSIVDKLISLGDSEIIHQPKIQELFCGKAKEQFDRKEYQNAYTSLSLVIDESDSPAKKLLSELRSQEQAIKAHEQAIKAREDSLARQFDYGARWFGHMFKGVPLGSGDLSIPYQGQTIWVKISDFSNGAPYRGIIYAFGNEFNLYSIDYSSNIVYCPSDSYSSYLITEYKYGSINTLIEEIIKNVDKLKNAKRNLAKQDADRKKTQRERQRKLEQWEKTHYHQVPREVRCGMCAGEGTIGYYTKQRCPQCYGRGYKLEHYY